MKIVCISDTHCQLSKMNVPDGDLLIHSGDATFQGTTKEIIEFNADLGKIKNKYTNGIVFIPGNHDFLYQNNPQLAKQFTNNATVLIHESTIINGLNIFGSPYTPWFHNWAFNVDREELHTYWEDIPADTNILITHGPPLGILDTTPRGEQVGCRDLYAKIQMLPALTHHIFGHIHYAYGTTQINKVTYINASSCTEQYKPTNPPIIVNI